MNISVQGVGQEALTTSVLAVLDLLTFYGAFGHHPRTQMRLLLHAVAGPELFKLLSQLPQQLSPSALNGMTSLQLDVCPEQPQDWLVLQQLPGLRELLLPGFKPAVPHQHLSALAHITQLTAATLSVQVSMGLSLHLNALVNPAAAVGAHAVSMQLSSHKQCIKSTSMAGSWMVW